MWCGRLRLILGGLWTVDPSLGTDTCFLQRMPKRRILMPSAEGLVDGDSPSVDRLDRARRAPLLVNLALLCLDNHAPKFHEVVGANWDWLCKYCPLYDL